MAPVRLTFWTVGPAATIVVSCMIGSTVAIAQSLGSTAAMTSLMFRVPASAASIFGWMVRSQMPVRLEGARIRGPGCVDRVVGVGVCGSSGGRPMGVRAAGVPSVATGVASSAGQP